MPTIADELYGLLLALEEAIPDVLEHEMADAVKEAISDQTYPNVYNAYDPKIWSRRGKSGGIADTRNMVALVSGNELIVRSEVPLQDLFARTVAAYTHNEQKTRISTGFKDSDGARKKIQYQSSLKQIAQNKKVSEGKRNAFETNKGIADHGNLANIVETGSGYNMPFPRPYHEDAESVIRGKADRIMQEALTKALHARGY